MSQSKPNKILLEEIKLMLCSLKDQIDDLKHDISKIKNSQFINDIINKANQDKDKFQIVEPKESSGWFW